MLISRLIRKENRIVKEYTDSLANRPDESITQWVAKREAIKSYQLYLNMIHSRDRAKFWKQLWELFCSIVFVSTLMGIILGFKFYEHRKGYQKGYEKAKEEFTSVEKEVKDDGPRPTD